MKEFEDLINKFLGRFQNRYNEPIEYEIRNIEVYEDRDDNKYIAFDVNDKIPKDVLDTIREMGYEVSCIDLGQKKGLAEDYRIAFEKIEEVEQ